MRAQRRLRRQSRPGLRARRALFAVLFLFALAALVGARLHVGPALLPPRTPIITPTATGMDPSPAVEPPRAAVGTAFRWVHLPVTYNPALAGPKTLGRPGSIHITFPREWQSVTFEVGGSVGPKPDVRVVCDACPGVNWVFHRPEDYSLQEGLLVDAATLGVLEVVGGSENVVEWNF